ncbi:hypothetical protein AAFF_G00003750 [Aldrovandia affinis]|uniref:Uncharacterized protein n=1 Tax=Aldrovandia affinis TaxID=143900 RepID=A0AAD7TDF1_9TELE|nr:hypothetical protein AAFF_G00003750 [Aldrovandia affinis]
MKVPNKLSRSNDSPMNKHIKSIVQCQLQGMGKACNRIPTDSFRRVGRHNVARIVMDILFQQSRIASSPGKHGGDRWLSSIIGHGLWMFTAYVAQCPVCLLQLLLDGTDGRNASVTCPSSDNIWETSWLFITKIHTTSEYLPGSRPAL